MTKTKALEALEALRTAAYGCGDSMMSSEDEMLAKRDWAGTSGSYGEYERHDNRPKDIPANPRKEYNKWYRENVCPKRDDLCGAPWLAKSATEELYVRAGLKNTEV